MVLYLFECGACQISFDSEGSMAKPPKRRKCPTCNKFCNRIFTAPALRFIGSDFYTNRAKAEKFQRDGFDKVQAHEFYNSAIKHSKERMEEGWKDYTRVTPNIENMIKTGAAKKVSSEKARAKKEASKNLTSETYKMAKINPVTGRKEK